MNEFVEGMAKLVRTGVRWYLLYVFFWPLFIVGSCGACYVCSLVDPPDRAPYSSASAASEEATGPGAAANKKTVKKAAKKRAEKTAAKRKATKRAKKARRRNAKRGASPEPAPAESTPGRHPYCPRHDLSLAGRSPARRPAATLGTTGEKGTSIVHRVIEAGCAGGAGVVTSARAGIIETLPFSEIAPRCGADRATTAG